MSVQTMLDRFATLLQRRIVPDLAYSQAVFEERLRTHSLVATRWLDLGCGHRLLSEWRADAEVELIRQTPFAVGLDVDFQAIRRHRSIRDLCLGDITKLPFRDASFDLVTANM